MEPAGTRMTQVEEMDDHCGTDAGGWLKARLIKPLGWVIKQNLHESMALPFSIFSASNKKEGEKKERGWVMDTSKFCLRTYLWNFYCHESSSYKQKQSFNNNIRCWFTSERNQGLYHSWNCKYTFYSEKDMLKFVSCY